ncbi:MAG: hypothetical protein SH850_04995 [Planctomycetaceae bacterium]|nr:hypothetical protein [Planctomycetaceae bacterium]
MNDPGFGSEPSLASSVEHLVAGSHGLLTKRVDLALLEGQEMLSQTINRAALLCACGVLALASWFAGTAAVVLVVFPDATAVTRLAAFGLFNGGTALFLFALASRRLPAAIARPGRDGALVYDNSLTADGTK